MHIDACFDSGNIVVVEATDQHARLRIRPDPATGAYQWFHFGVVGQGPRRFFIEDLAGASFPDGWPTTRVVVSEQSQWMRLPTTYADGVLSFDHTPSASVHRYALFAPYPLSRHQRLVERLAQRAPVEVLGQTLDGRPLHAIQVGEDGPVAWVIARQHAGETMAEWFIEGLLDRLLDPHDGLAQTLRARAVLHVVPNMNPDGTFRGHIRGNAAGTDLNRAWQDPGDHAPEVVAVRARMERTGVQLFMDIHGDEARPYNFVAGPEGVPSFTPAIGAELARFKATYAAANPHFQTERGYRVCPPGKANLALATHAVSERFRCLGMTLEQPFSDVDYAPDPQTGWSPGRARALGAAALDPIAEHLLGR